MTAITRGAKSLNPGNIRISDTPWLGKVEPSPDADFETFDTMEHGIRAMAKILLTYFDKHQLRTIAAIISRWAPTSENDTMAYIEDVEDRTGYDRTLILNLRQPFMLCRLIQAIIHHENGSDVATTEQIATGVQEALA